jgi:hypothetical protein
MAGIIIKAGISEEKSKLLQCHHHHPQGESSIPALMSQLPEIICVDLR